MASNATTAIFIDRYHPKKNGKCAVSIRITHNRVKKYFPTKFNLTVNEYDRMMGDRPRKELKDVLLQLQSLEKKAADIIDKLTAFSFPIFERHFIANRGLANTVNYAFDQYIQSLENEERIGTALSYRVAKNSLNEYGASQNILVKTELNDKNEEKKVSNYTFSYVTSAFLKNYEKWMFEKGSSPTTIGIYLRSLRTIFNVAIEDGLITREFYPFGKRRYDIPSSRNIKKALSLEHVGLIYNYQADAGSTREMAKDYWLFMYFTNGINVKDLCLLKHKDISDDFIVFERAKTIRTKKIIEKITVPLLDEIKTIIARQATQSISEEAYVFPVLRPNLNAVRERELIQLRTRVINDHMKEIAKELNIKSNLTTYVARHTFSTILKRSGASIEYISESLGHASVKTTRSYLDSFEDEQKKETNKALAAFKMKAS